MPVSDGKKKAAVSSNGEREKEAAVTFTLRLFSFYCIAAARVHSSSFSLVFHVGCELAGYGKSCERYPDDSM